jgi:hypothetical protein
MCLIIRSLFNDVFNCLSYVTSNGRIFVNVKIKGVWQEAVVTYSEILSRRFPAGTEEVHENNQSNWLPGQDFNPWP